MMKFYTTRNSNFDIIEEIDSLYDNKVITKYDNKGSVTYFKDNYIELEVPNFNNCFSLDEDSRLFVSIFRNIIIRKNVNSINEPVLFLFNDKEEVLGYIFTPKKGLYINENIYLIFRKKYGGNYTKIANTIRLMFNNYFKVKDIYLTVIWQGIGDKEMEFI